MKVPFLDLRAQLEAIEAELKAAVLEVIDSTQYILGPKVEAFERELAAYTGSAHAIGVSSGTDALLVALMALDVGADDIVVTTPFTFFATGGTIARLGARQVFVDIDPATYNIDPVALAKWFEDNEALRGKVKAIMPVHLYGQCADMTPILEVAAHYGIAVVEDAAQAIGAGYPTGDGLRKAASMGDFGCFSFFPSKNLGGVGEGGMVVTNDAALVEKVRRLRNHGMEPKYYHPMVGGNFRLDPIQAAVLSVKLRHLDDWHAMRRDNAAYYDEHLKIEGLRTPIAAYGREHHIYNQYVISVPDRREALRARFNEREIGHDVYYPVPMHLQECFSDLGYGPGDFPNSEAAAASTIALPIFPELPREMQAYVAETVSSFYAEALASNPDGRC